ncbi:hypothetical protein [Devosia lacusdianchii]|jgi:hypothetical protein|uniref:hypothetical protein n=1 Tax=Devosia lacusdianchii TaxID=2917991 RepID=UPI001F05E0B5|nr:hypothetical protein [Devosia sp. JXJ CY 41]
MIGWLLKKVARQPAAKPAEPVRSVPGENCALWHDVARALDQSSRAAARTKSKGVAR